MRLLLLWCCCCCLAATSFASPTTSDLSDTLNSPRILPAEKDDDVAVATKAKEEDSGKRVYEGYRLLRANPSTKEHLEILKFIASGIEDYWTPIPAVPSRNSHVDMLISPLQFSHVTGYLNCSGLDYSVTIEDLQRSIDEENIPEAEDAAAAVAEAVGRNGELTLRSKRQITFGSLLRSVFGGLSEEEVREQRSPPRVRQTRHFNAPQNSNLNNIPPHLPPQPPPPLPPSDQEGLCTSKSRFNWHMYHRMDTINAYLDCLALEHKDKVTLLDIGKSHNGQRLTVIKIGRVDNNPDKKAIWIDGGIHAREWISPASVMYILHQLVEKYDENKDIVDYFDIYIMPVMNPDGYEYTFTNDRMWRKTRSNPFGYAQNNRCVGADPNRNFGYKWGGEGASNDPCQETYMGQSAFSESETRAVQQFILQRAKNIKLYLTFHSYGQYILYPWGYTDAGVPPNWKDLNSLGQVAARAMKQVGNHDYTIGSAAQVLYPAAGGSDDWAKGAAGIEYSYTIELPDTGRYGFILPANHITPTVRSAFAGVTAMTRELRNRT